MCQEPRSKQIRNSPRSFINRVELQMQSTALQDKSFIRSDGQEMIYSEADQSHTDITNSIENFRTRC